MKFLLSTRDAAEQLGMSQETFVSKVLPGLRVVRLSRGAHIRVPVSEIEAWLNKTSRGYRPQREVHPNFTKARDAANSPN